ncbi:hypothetical protein [Streptomyces collinus]|uniref:hypothetical protein n=1 Tax=Streptomyces collinus TaxID=42684 RepID=UPI00363BF116
MTEPKTGTNDKQAASRATAAKARRTAGKTTAPAAKAAKSAADKADDAASATKSMAISGVERSADTVGSAAQGMARAAEAGRQTLVTATGQVAATAKAATGQVAGTAKTALAVIAHRKLIAAGVGAGVTALTAVSYAAGRRSGRHSQGPITRLTGGRI